MHTPRPTRRVTAYARRVPGPQRDLMYVYPEGVPSLGIAPFSTLIVERGTGVQLTAAQMLPGHVIIRSGRAPRTDAPITVTAVRPSQFGDTVAIQGFTAANLEPRLMFRSLTSQLPMLVLIPAGVTA